MAFFEIGISTHRFKKNVQYVELTVLHARAKNEEHFLPVLIPLRTSEYLEFEVYIIPTGAYTPKNELLHYLSKRPVNQDEYFVVLRVSPSR